MPPLSFSCDYITSGKGIEMSSRCLIVISRFLSPSDRVQRRDNIKNWRKHISERDKYVLEE